MHENFYTIGYAECSSQVSFHQKILSGLTRAAAQYPSLTILLRDNNMDTEKTHANLREFAEVPVNLVIVCQVDEREGSNFIKPLVEKQIPVISLEVPIPMTISFGVDNRAAGILLGKGLGSWIKGHWNGKLKKVLVMTDYRFTGVIRQRIDYAVKSLKEDITIKDDQILHLQGDSYYEGAYTHAKTVLERWGTDTHTVIIGNNDDAALGALDAAAELGFGDRVIGGGFGASLTETEFSKPDSRFIASIAFYPERYGEPLLNLAIDILEGRSVKTINHMQPELVMRA